MNQNPIRIGTSLFSLYRVFVCLLFRLFFVVVVVAVVCCFLSQDCLHQVNTGSPLETLCHNQALSYDSGTKHTVTMAADRLGLHRRTASDENSAC